MPFPYRLLKPNSTLTLSTIAQQRYKICLALTAFVLSAALVDAGPATVPDSTPRLNLASDVCGELADTLEPPRAWIPVGCESRLCCVGCPQQDIDWRVRVSGDTTDSVLLNFENLTPEAARKLRIKGKARWEGRALRVMPGETIVSGFKNDPRATPVVATPRLFAKQESLKRLGEAVNPGADRAVGRMEVNVEQMMGKYPISEARVAYNVRRCASLPNTGDRIVLNNNALNDNAIAIIDARTGNGTCLDDEDFRGVGVVNVGDLQPFDICTSDTSIFSDDNGMYFLSPTIWTDSPTDERIADLPQMFRAPVAVWIAIDESGAQERAEWDMANANFLYNRNNVGIAFDATFTSALQLAEIARPACAAVDRIKASNFYKPDRLNVYYIDNWTTIRFGKTCWNDADNKPVSPGMIFINRWAPTESLAHEFGHAFSLDDLNLLNSSTTQGIAGNNIMWQGNPMRTDFTIGQAFRMNVNVKSMINVNSVRVGWATRDCHDETTNNRCPALRRDVTPK